MRKVASNRTETNKQNINSLNITTMDWIIPPLVAAIVFGTAYKLVELCVRKRERLMLINKLTEISNVDFKGINLYSSGNKFTALRIGWLLVGIGAGFLLGFLINLWTTQGEYTLNINYEYQNHYQRYVGSIVYVACICICGGLALLQSYRAERKAEEPKEKKKKKDDEFEI